MISEIKNRTKTNKIAFAACAVLAMTLFFLFPETAHAASAGLILGSNMKADSITVNTMYFNVYGYDLDIEGSGGFTVGTGTTVNTYWDETRVTTINIAGGLSLSNTCIFDVIPAITFDATSGTHWIDTGNKTLPSVTLAASGATYNLNTYNMTTQSLTISGGTLDLTIVQLDLIDYGNLLINGGTLNANHANCDLNIDGNVTVTSGSLIAPPVADSTSFLVGGNWSITGTGTFTPSNGRVYLDTAGANDQITTSSSNTDDFYQLYFANGVGSFTFLQSDISVRSSLVMLNGTLDADADGDGAGATISNLSIGGALTASPGYFNARTSTVTFDGSGTQSIAGNSLYHVVVNNTGNPGNVYLPPNILGNLTVNDGAAVAPGYNINLAGNLSVAVGATISIVAPQTFTFNGATASTVSTSGQISADIVINKTDTVAPSTNNKVTLTGNMSANSVTIDGTTGQSDILDLASSGYTLTLTGNGTPLVVNTGGTLTVGTNSIIKFAPAATTGVTVPAITYRHIEFDMASNTFTLAGALDVDGNLTLTNGVLDLDTNNSAVNVAGNVSIASGATVTKDAQGAAWTFDGTTQSYSDANVSKQDLGAVVI